ncbi:hypothetical protein GQ600_9920 [Phytophthora cactorum]|nr:hypothetical protein GQ600_9920 [Phytophthora cactorum]
MKESTGLHTQDLELARAEVAERDAVIHALESDSQRNVKRSKLLLLPTPSKLAASCHSDQGSERQVC